jgi:hypothetical protein
LEGLKILVELMGSFLVKLALLFEEGWLGPWWSYGLYLSRRLFSPWWTCMLRGRSFHRMDHQHFFCKC